MCLILIFYIKVMAGYQSNEVQAQINTSLLESSQHTSSTEIIYKSAPNITDNDLHIADNTTEQNPAANSMGTDIFTNTPITSLVHDKQLQDNKEEIINNNNMDQGSSLSDNLLLESSKDDSIAKNIDRQIDPKKPMVALTFDDGPHYEYTNKILDALEKYNGAATFFVLGSRAEKNKDIIKRIVQSGNQVGNHTYDHKQLTKLGSKEIINDLTKTSDIIQDITNIRPSLLRPPYGNINDNVKLYADAPLILWSIDTLDWKSRNKQKIVNAALKKVKNGDIILMHDIYKATALAAEVIIKELSSRGYQLVTIDELYEAKGMELSKGKVYAHAYGKTK